MKDIFFKTLMLKGESGSTITSIEKISAEGGVMQMRMTLSDGQVIDFPVNDVPDTDLINNLIELGIVDLETAVEGLTTVISETLSASGWSSTAPYTYELTVEGVTVSDDYEIIGFTPTNSAATNALIKEALGYITYGVTSTDTITFYAVEDKPETNIPIVLRRIISNG